MAFGPNPTPEQTGVNPGLSCRPRWAPSSVSCLSQTSSDPTGSLSHRRLPRLLPGTRRRRAGRSTARATLYVESFRDSPWVASPDRGDVAHSPAACAGPLLEGGLLAAD